jgi:caffeoyl-CoA O-methyltransferase
MKHGGGVIVVSLVCALVVVSIPAPGGDGPTPAERDAKVEHFLQARERDWRDMNVPMRDGQFLHDLIVEKGYTRALEIGTSTGHSSIWIARALSKTGGRLVTLEIDSGRHREALRNFEEAGVADVIDARLGDAHELVKTLEGPFDFVFSDADKEWYTRYFIDVAPTRIRDDGRGRPHHRRRRDLPDRVTALHRERASAAAAASMKVVPVLTTYSFSNHRNGHSSLCSGKSGWTMTIPGTMPPGMKE